MRVAGEMMNPAAARSMAAPLLTIGERVLGTLVFVLALGVLLYTAWILNGEEGEAHFVLDTNDVAERLDGQLGELDTLMTTLVGMHQLDAGADELAALGVLAAELREQTPAVTAIGRYAAVDGEGRERFERDLLDSGLYAFRITSIDAGGHAGVRPEAARYHPVSLLEPMTPERLRLIGADLGEIDGLGVALDRIAADDRSLMTTLPAHWPLGEELLTFHTVYRGSHVPSDLAERLRQADGGYWLAADPRVLLEGSGTSSGHLSAELRVSGADGSFRRLLSRTGHPDTNTVLHALYPPPRIERRWTFGDGELVLELTGEIGVPIGLLVALAGVATLTLLALLLAGSHVSRGRLALRERARGVLDLQAERERADRTLNAIDDAVFALDTGQQVLHLNPAAARLAGHTRSGVLGRPLGEALALRHEENGALLDLDAVFAAIEHGGAKELDVLPAEDASGEIASVLRLSVSRTRDADGATSGHILVLRDISDERRLTRRLAWQANHDALTGCTNRRWFEARLGELLADLPDSGRRHALCYIDLDQFKVVNDTKGHAAGDRLLQELTGGLQALCREGDMLSRLGGDEFGLLIVDADEKAARRAADRVHDFFQGYTFRDGQDTFAVRASIGFVPLDEGSGTIGDVLAAADLACYAAKEGGRNGLYVYSSDDETMSRRSSELERLPELRRALANDRFELHAQAVASLDPCTTDGTCTGDITHFEFLLRLTGEDGVPLTPFRIIEAAERYGLMREIDRWVIARAVASVAAIGDGPGSACSFSINLSGQSAADPTLIDFIEREYARHDVDPARIWFELTETAAISQFPVAVELATRIRALGSKVALDDFGSGLSSFGYLKNIPVDVLKIDGQFVRHIADNPIDRTMVRAIAEVARSMNIVTVAEFVENQAILDELMSLGIDYAQGYHVGRPRPLPEALAALAPADDTPWHRVA